MTINRQYVAFSVLALALATGAWRLKRFAYVPLDAHWDPIVVDNPLVAVNFDPESHPVVITRENGDVLTMSRDVTAVKGIALKARKETGDPSDIGVKPVSAALLLTNDKHVEIGWTDNGTNDNNTVTFTTKDHQFGSCRFDSFFNNRCAASDKSLRLHALKVTDDQKKVHYFCLNDRSEKNNPADCPPPDSENPVKIVLLMVPEPKK